MSNGENQKVVAIFGAGIAGLTAAHELIERGFEVEIYEPEEASPLEAMEQLREPQCSVGGQACTEMARVELPPDRAAGWPAGTPLRTVDEVTPLTLELMKTRLRFTPGSKTLSKDVQTALTAVAALLNEYTNVGKIVIRGYTHQVEAKPAVINTVAGRDDYQRALAVRDFLAGAGVAATRLDVLARGFGYPNEVARTDAERCYVELEVEEDLLPGEHGFRFFPSFYRHVFDSMRRTPIAEDRPTYVETGRTTLDNIIPTTSQGLNFENPGRSFIFPRRRLGSLQEAFDLLKDLLDIMGFTLADIARLQVKLFKYMTSCSQRRQREYENISWWDFMEGDRFSARFQRYLEAAPQLLVAMRASQGDARTIGNITVQTTLDQLRSGEHTDGTLNAPTALAWLRHWRRFLEHQGVVFKLGGLNALRWLDGRLVAEAWEDSEDQITVRDDCDCVIVALPSVVAKEIVDTVVSESGYADGDFGKIHQLDLGDPTQADPGGTLDHLHGMQFYFTGEIKFVPGHTIYADSAWGLSSIFQPQFWTRRRGAWDGYRGLFSVDIGNWHNPSPVTGRSAWDSTRKEIAEEVWRQIKATIENPDAAPDPIFYRLTDDIEFDRTRADGQKIPSRDDTPFVINKTGLYRLRPGEPGNYRVHSGGVVFAGSWVQTHTRMNTMEAANESARHAVNAVLDAVQYKGDRCQIWPPEEYELADLRYLRELDERLVEQGLPHVLDILNVEDLGSLIRDGIQKSAAAGLWPFPFGPGGAP